MAVRAVLLDLGDTLMFQARAPNEDALYGRMAEQVRPLLSAWNTAPVDAGALLRDLYRAVETAQPERRARSHEVDGPFIARGALASYGVNASPAQAEAFWRATAVDFTLWGWQLYPDTLDTLRRLRQARIPAAIVSNGWYRSELRSALLASLGITDDLVDAFVSSADLLRPKPRPELFLRALEALAVEAGEAVFVGDDLEADVRGAKALGLTTVWKLNGRQDPPPAPEADFAIHDLWELFTLGVLPEAGPAPMPQESLTPHEDGNAGRY